MRQRYQKGSLCKRGKFWVVQFREDGKKKKRKLGLISKMTKTEAQKEVANILAPINNRGVPPSQSWLFGDFVERIYLPFYRRKWKRSTAMTNEDRLNHHLVSEFGELTLGTFHRDQLQDFPLPRRQFRLELLQWCVMVHQGMQDLAGDNWRDVGSPPNRFLDGSDDFRRR